MSKNFKKIYVVSPAGYCSGGPESLHNLVSVMNILGLNAYISYLPETNLLNSQYLSYNIPVENYHDHENNLIIFPEIFCMQALKIKKAKAAIWWLSVDNFREIKYGTFRDKIRYLIKVIKRQRPVRGIKSLKELIHFSKAHYDKEYLDYHGIISKRIEGPISRNFLNHIPQKSKTRLDGILYNEKKSKIIVDKLKESLPDLVFIPLNNMKEDELISHYQSHKIYIDFGTHPGKERMPREAALMGCCVITGKLGAAKNSYDVAIPEEYKLDHKSKEFITNFSKIANQIIDNYPEISPKFEYYRERIRSEFKNQIEDVKREFIY